MANFNHIQILFDSKNNVILKDTMTNIFWLYSFQKPIAYYDGKIHIYNYNLTQTNKRHISNFKEYLEKLFDK